jgi:hypothetical protein
MVAQEVQGGGAGAGSGAGFLRPLPRSFSNSGHQIQGIRKTYLDQAEQMAAELESAPEQAFKRDRVEVEELKYFYYPD